MCRKPTNDVTASIICSPIIPTGVETTDDVMDDVDEPEVIATVTPVNLPTADVEDEDYEPEVIIGDDDMDADETWAYVDEGGSVLYRNGVTGRISEADVIVIL